MWGKTKKTKKSHALIKGNKRNIEKKMQTCIQCKKKPAKWQEERNSKNAYCGNICQKEYYYYSLVGLKDEELTIDDDNIIGLEAGGGLKIRITKEQAQESETIKNLMEDANHDDYIPIPPVDNLSLEHIKHFFKFGEVNTNNLTNNEFENLLVAASYLDFPRLLIYLMPEWVNYRPFPGNSKPLQQQALMRQALYFYEGNDFNNPKLEKVETQTKKEFQDVISYTTANEWQFRKACKDGLLPVVQRIVYLKKWKLNPAAYNNWAIRRAAENGHLEVVKYLMSLNDSRIDVEILRNYFNVDGIKDLYEQHNKRKRVRR